jgi:hypothetical protein
MMGIHLQEVKHHENNLYLLKQSALTTAIFCATNPDISTPNISEL